MKCLSLYYVGKQQALHTNQEITSHKILNLKHLDLELDDFIIVRNKYLLFKLGIQLYFVMEP